MNRPASAGDLAVSVLARSRGELKGGRKGGATLVVAAVVAAGLVHNLWSRGAGSAAG